MIEQNQEASSSKVTVLFLSFSGFSNLQQGAGSGEIASLLGRCISFTDHIIRLYSGIPDKYMGESLIAFYGMNEEGQKSCINAIKSAIEMQNKFSEIKSEENLPEPLGLKIGIFSGEVFNARIGAGTKIQENYFGEAIQFASHICSMATPGQILVGEESRKQAANDFTFNVLEPVPVKGYKKPIAIFEVTVKSGNLHEPPLQSGRIITSRMIGRQQDSRLLEEQIKQLLNGRGGVVNIEGIAGIGKSRLMAEIMQKEIIRNVAFFEGRALSEGKNLSFHPIIQVIKSWSVIKEDDSPAVSYQKLSQNIIRIYPEQATEIIPFVATMMGYTLDGEARQRVKGIEGEALERLILKNLRDLLSRAATLRPIVIMIEDAHWADLSSISFMESLFKLVKNHRLLFINVFRPGYKETGERLSAFVKENLPEHYREINVKPLTETESAELIGNLLNQTNLPDDIKQLIVTRSEGNPFFIEEVLRSFIDEGLIEVKDNAFIVTDRIQYANIPETIDKVILSRIDRLDEKTKGLLRTASVIGRNFYYKVLEEAAQTIEELDTRLEYLKETQLLYEHKNKEEVEFLFKHALAQQATYDSILQKTKKELHLKIAKSIEKVFADKLPEFYGVLAMHYEKAEVPKKTEEYLILAGDESFRSGASSEALNFYLNAIKGLTYNKENTATASKYMELEIKIGFAHQAAGNNIEANEYFIRILSTYYAKPFPVTEIGNIIKSAYNMIGFVFKLYFQSLYFRKQPDKDFDQYVKVLSQWGEALTTLNPKRFFQQSFYFMRGLANYDLSKTVHGLSLFVECANLFLWTGVSLKISQKMIDIAKKLKVESHPNSMINYRFTKKMQDYHSGIFEEDKDLENVFQVGMRMGEFWPTTIYTVYCGYVNIEIGKIQSFYEMVGKLKEIADSFDNSHAQSQVYRLSAVGNFRFRNLDLVLADVQNGIGYLLKTGHFTALLIVWCVKSQTHSLRKETDEARNAFAEADKLIHDKKIIPTYYIHFLQAKAYIEMLELEMCITHKRSVNQKSAILMKTINQLIRQSKTVPSSGVEAWRLKAMFYLLAKNYRKTLKCFSRSIQIGQKYNCSLELSRTYFEAGKFLQEMHGRQNTILGFSGNEYLLKAKSMFEEMDLQWDLKEYEKYMET